MLIAPFSEIHVNLHLYISGVPTAKLHRPVSEVEGTETGGELPGHLSLHRGHHETLQDLTVCRGGKHVQHQGL